MRKSPILAVVICLMFTPSTCFMEWLFGQRSEANNEETVTQTTSSVTFEIPTADNKFLQLKDTLDNLSPLDACYHIVFKAIKELTPNRKVDTFVVDFEAGLWQGIRSVFEEPVIHGCSFHFGQALWRKVQENGLQPTYHARDNVYKALRKVFALPLLPAGDIREAFDTIRAKVDPEATSVVEFMTYVDNTWMDNPMWPVESWSIYGRSVRTNNDCEGWHAMLNRRAKKANLPFYLLTSLFYEEANMIPTQVKLIQEGKLRRHQRKQTTKTQGRLNKLWDRYGNHENSTNTLLK